LSDVETPNKEAERILHNKQGGKVTLYDIESVK